PGSPMLAAVLRRGPAAQRQWERWHPRTQHDRPQYPKGRHTSRVTRSETGSSSSYHHRLLGRGRKALERWPSVAILVATINNASPSLNDELGVAISRVGGVFDQSKLQGIPDFHDAVLDRHPRLESEFPLDLGEGGGDVPHVAAEAEILVRDLEAGHVSADQRDNLVLRVIATVRPEIEDLTADLLRSTSECQRNSLSHIADMDEGSGVSALINNQFALRYRFENELIH